MLLATTQVVGNLGAVLAIVMPVEFEVLLYYFRSLSRFDIISFVQLGCISDGGYITSLLSNILMILMVVLAVSFLYFYQKSKCEHEDYGKHDKEHEKHLEELFGRIDVDGNGITAAEVAHILKKCDPAVDANKQVLKMFKKADANKSGSISSVALLQIMVDCNMDPNDDNPAAKELFEAVGGEGDGEINFDEFHSLLVQSREDKVDDDAKKLVAKADKSETGRLNFQEFLDAVVDHADADKDGTVDFQVLVRKKALADVRDVASGRLFLLVFLLYPSVTNKIFEGLSCRSLGEDKSVLYVDYSIDCGSLEYYTLAILCLALVVIWPIGLPSGLLYYMWKEKDDIKKQDADTLQKFSFVLGDYDAEHWYWEVVELSRKLILTGIIGLFQRGSIAQVVAATMLSFFFFAITIREQPFQTKHLNIIKVVSEIQLFVILLVCCVLQTHHQGFAAEVVTPGDYGQLQVFATVAVMPITVYLLFKGLRYLDANLLSTQKPNTNIADIETPPSHNKRKKAKKVKKAKKAKKVKKAKSNKKEDQRHKYDNPLVADDDESATEDDEPAMEDDESTHYDIEGDNQQFSNPLVGEGDEPDDVKRFSATNDGSNMASKDDNGAD